MTTKEGVLCPDHGNDHPLRLLWHRGADELPPTRPGASPGVKGTTDSTVPSTVWGTGDVLE